MAFKPIFKVCCFLMIIFFTSPASAVEWFVGLELPTNYTFKNADDGTALDPDGSPSGFLLSAHMTEYSVGAILESYEISLKDSGDSKISRTLIDLYYVTPIPYVQVSVGGGYGFSEVKGTYAGDYDQGTALQYLLRLGFMVSDSIEIHWNYRMIQSRIKLKNSDNLLETGGTMTSLGASIGF